jgi:hypothetical protein
MPLPTPNKGEQQQDFVSRCISFETKASPDRDPKQVQAMCFAQWRRAKAGKLSEEDFNTLERYALFADNQGYASQFTKKKGIKLWRKQVLKFGTWVHPDNKDITFEITPNVVKQIVANFNAGVPDEAPVTLTHSDNPKDKTGKIKSFIETSDGLDAIFSVEDDTINDRIEKASDSVPGVSCWLDLNYKDKQTGDELGAVVKHVALVNHPYIEGMSGFNAVLSSFEESGNASSSYLPLVMSEKKNVEVDETMAEMSKEDLIKALKEKHELDIAALLSSAEELTTLHDRIDRGELVDSKSVSLGEDLLKQIKEKLALSAADSLTIPELVQKLLEKVASLTTVESKLTEAQTKLSDLQADKEVSALLSEGRILPVEKDVFLSMFKKTPEVFAEMAKARRDMKKTLVELSETGVAYEPQVGDEAKATLARNLEAAEKEGRVKKQK